MKEPGYDDMTMVRMAIVQRDDYLVVLMPPEADMSYVENFIKHYEAYGWPSNRLLVMQGPQAFAVLKAAEGDSDQLG